MKKLGFLFALSLMVMVSCKNDASTGETADAETPSVPTSTAVNTPTAATPPVKANEPAVPAGPITTIEFKETEHDFGMIMEGAKGSCGCTVPDWPREPIAPGASSVIKVQFDSKNKGKVGGGLQSKRVTLTSNTDPVNTYLTIKGKVDKEATAEEPAKNPS